MVRDAAIHEDFREPITDDYRHMLSKYFSRSPYETAEIFAIYLQNLSFLFSCALSCGYIDRLSQAFFNYVLFLDKGIAKMVLVDAQPYNLQEEISILIKNIAETGMFINFFKKRICEVMSSLKLIVKHFSSKFRSEYLSSLKSGLKRFPKHYKDREGFAIGKLLHEIPL